MKEGNSALIFLVMDSSESDIVTPDSNVINLTIRTPKESKSIEIKADATVEELRSVVSKTFDAPADRLCLIFAGKILKDGEKLADHSIKDGLAIHLVIKSLNRTQQPPPETSPDAAANSEPPASSEASNPFAGMGGLGGLFPGLEGGSLPDMQSQMQRELLRNPEAMRNMMNNPLVQQMLDSPDVMRQMITANPQMREVIERNPEINHILDNPALMRQTMEMMRNPNMMNEMIRQQDRAMSNLESLPGGFNALQRLYHDVQNPLLQGAQDSFAPNPFASLANPDSAGSNAQQGRENSDPLPNPWAPPSSTGGGNTAPATSAANTASITSSPGSQQAFRGFDSPGMQSLLDQLSTNPQMMQNMLNAPYMQTMMNYMGQNPDMARQLFSGHPMFQNNPQLQQYVEQQLPTFVQQMNNPEIRTALTNPRAMEAVLQIQRGMQQLQTEAPGLLPGFGLANTGTANSTDGGDPASRPTPAGGPETTQALAQMMQMMSQGQPTPSGANLPPEQRFAPQLEQLAAMGMVNREANIQALTATYGDINAALDRLLQQSQLRPPDQQQPPSEDKQNE